MSKISLSEAFKTIKEAIKRVKSTDAIKKCFEEYNLDLDEIDLIPICFADLDVSARTEKGIIYLNWDLLEEGFPENDHYLAHEITHFAQQTTGDGPTQGSTDDNYLDNKFEREGFQVQTEYISETEGDKEAENYIDGVLEYHDVEESDRPKKKKQLLQLASKQLDLFPEPPKRQERMSKFRELLTPSEQRYIVKNLRNILDAIEQSQSSPDLKERKDTRRDKLKQLLLELESP